MGICAGCLRLWSSGHEMFNDGALAWASVMVVSVKASASLGCAVLLPPMMSACAWLSRALVSASTEAGSPSTHWNFTLLGSLSLSLKTYTRRGPLISLIH